MTLFACLSCHNGLKVGFHYPSSRAELTARVRASGFHYPSWRPELTGVKKCTRVKKCIRVLGPSTRVVETDLKRWLWCSVVYIINRSVAFTLCEKYCIRIATKWHCHNRLNRSQTMRQVMTRYHWIYTNVRTTKMHKYMSQRSTLRTKQSCDNGWEGEYKITVVFISSQPPENDSTSQTLQWFLFFTCISTPSPYTTAAANYCNYWIWVPVSDSWAQDNNKQTLTYSTKPTLFCTFITSYPL